MDHVGDPDFLPQVLIDRRPPFFLFPFPRRGGTLAILPVRLRLFLLIQLKLPMMQGLKFSLQFRILPLQNPDPVIPGF